MSTAKDAVGGGGGTTKVRTKRPRYILTTRSVQHHHPHTNLLREEKRWNTHIEEHRNKISAVKSSLTDEWTPNETISEWRATKRRSNIHENRQRVATIQEENLRLLQKINKISNTRSENVVGSFQENREFYYKRWAAYDISNLMKSVREDEAKNINEQKGKIKKRITWQDFTKFNTLSGKTNTKKRSKMIREGDKRKIAGKEEQSERGGKHKDNKEDLKTYQDDEGKLLSGTTEDRCPSVYRCPSPISRS